MTLGLGGQGTLASECRRQGERAEVLPGRVASISVVPAEVNTPTSFLLMKPSLSVALALETPRATPSLVSTDTRLARSTAPSKTNTP